MKKVDNPQNKMSAKFEPGFRIEETNDNGLTYVIRRSNPAPGQLTLFKAHHNQLRYDRKGRNDPESKNTGRTSSAVNTLLRLGRLTVRPDWAVTKQSEQRRPQEEQEEARQHRELSEQGEETISRNVESERENITWNPIVRVQRLPDEQEKPTQKTKSRICQKREENVNRQHTETQLQDGATRKRPTRNRRRPAHLAPYECN